MDEKTTLLVSLGAAVAANCVSCFEHYYGKALAAGLAASEIAAAVETAAKVQKGAHLVLKNRVNDLLGGASGRESSCGDPRASNCCG